MPPARSSTTATTSSSPPDSADRDMPERSRNAKAQARHREKRKAYISHLEESVASLKAQLNQLGISGPGPIQSPEQTKAAAEQTDGRLADLIEENDRLKAEIRNLKSRIDFLATSPNSSSLLIPEASSSRRPSAEYDGAGPTPLPSLLGPADDTNSYLGLFPHNTTSTTQTQQVPLSLTIPRSPNALSDLGLSGLPQQAHYYPTPTRRPNSSPSPHLRPPHAPRSSLGKSPLSGTHLTQHRHSLPSPLPSSSSVTSTPSTSAASSFSPFTPSFDTTWSSHILNGNFSQLPNTQQHTQHRGRELSFGGYNVNSLVSAVRGEPWTGGDITHSSPLNTSLHPITFPQQQQYALLSCPPSRATSRATNDSSLNSTSHSRTRSDGSSPRTLDDESPQLQPMTAASAFGMQLKMEGQAGGQGFDFVPGEVEWGTGM